MADLLIHGASQLLTVAGPGPKAGEAQGDVGLIEGGALAIVAGRVAWVGAEADLPLEYRQLPKLDAGGRAVVPGLVDPHTHFVFGGDRADEFERRLQGASYQEIMAAGGGIMATVRATRALEPAALAAESRARLERMIAHGSTTVEGKTGYGLARMAELRQLEVLEHLDATHPVNLVPTYLAAHAVPEEYRGREEAYVEAVLGWMEEVAPADDGAAERAVRAAPGPPRGPTTPAQRWRRRQPDRPWAPFIDVFCEEGAFTLEQSRAILERGRELGFALKIHADEFSHTGGAVLAAELGATSADHLNHTPPEEMALLARAGTVAVLLPCTPFGLGLERYADARALIAHRVPVALASDLNPGTAWNESLPFAMALAARTMRMTPAECLVAATLNAAYAVGLGEEVGSLEPGKLGDAVVLAFPDYRHLTYRVGTNPVYRVIKEGRIIWPP